MNTTDLPHSFFEFSTKVSVGFVSVDNRRFYMALFSTFTTASCIFREKLLTVTILWYPAPFVNQFYDVFRSLGAKHPNSM